MPRSERICSVVSRAPARQIGTLRNEKGPCVIQPSKGNDRKEGEEGLRCTLCLDGCLRRQSRQRRAKGGACAVGTRVRCCKVRPGMISSEYNSTEQSTLETVAYKNEWDNPKIDPR